MTRTWLRVMFGFIILGACSTVFAQGTATFNGRVTDTSGAVIPGATVTVTNRATGLPRPTTTNENGLYSIPALPAGAYDVKVELQGFATSTRSGINLGTDTTLSLDFQMAVGGIEQAVQVTGGTPLVETTTSHVTSSLRNQEVQELPMLNRTLSALIALNPGVREETTNMNVPGTSTTHTYFNVGGNGRNSMELVDGMDNHDDTTPGPRWKFPWKASRSSTSWRTAPRPNTVGPEAESPVS